MVKNLHDIQAFFKDLSFVEDTHKYYVKDKALETSVSGIIKNFVEPVDFGLIAKYKDEQYGLAKGTTQKLWDLKAEEACSKGNHTHYFGEVYCVNQNITPCNAYQEAVVSFWKDLPSHIKLVGPEITMYHKNNMFGGTCDILLYNEKTGKYIIADYKTNIALHSNFKGKTLQGPFKDLLETNYNKYQIQFSLYQILIEQIPGIEVESRKLIWLLPSGEYKMYSTDNYTDRLRTYLDEN